MKDCYQEITDRIVAAIEAGTAPWVRPWSVSDQRPKNAATGRLYRGINSLLLGLEAQARGYATGAWLTYRQTAAAGGQVRGGEHGTSVALYKLHEVDDTKAEGEKRVIPLLRTFTVFNVAQIDGLQQTTQPTWTWGSHLEAELVLTSSGADIRHGTPKAYYTTVTDRIHLPVKQAFKDQGAYYTTALHELTHWTGHPKRCNRDLSGRFGNDIYAMQSRRSTPNITCSRERGGGCSSRSGTFREQTGRIRSASLPARKSTSLCRNSGTDTRERHQPKPSRHVPYE